MRTGSRFVATVAITMTTGCSGIGILNKPPPTAPPQAEPPIDLPEAPPGPGHTRVVLDANGEQAKVSRVIAFTNMEGNKSARLDGNTSLAPPRAEEPLCITPCAVDLRQGAHTLLFTSMQDPLRSSTSDVVLASNASTMFVRHSIGTEGHVTGSYVGGAILLLLGGGTTLMGGILSTYGAFGEPTRQDDGTMSNPRAALVPGLVTLGLGLALTAGGAILMANNRPVKQRGATTAWTK